MLPKTTPALTELTRFVTAACEAALPVTGARAIALCGETFAIPAVPDSEGFMFVKLAGARACVVGVFDAKPEWLSRTNGYGDSPPMSLVEKQPGEAWMRWRPESEPGATLASLVVYLGALVDVFVTRHPDDADVFPVLDDDAIARMLK